MCQLSPVTFHGDTIFCIDYQNQPYTPMRPIVENMGLNWASQSAKLTAHKERWTVAMIATVAQDGVEREMLSMPVRKLPAYLASINPKKVRAELRPKIELYQAESDDALWNYWTQGKAERFAGETELPPSFRSELKSLVDAKLSTYPASIQGKARSEIWTRFNRHFRIAEYAQLPAERMPEARDYLIELKPSALKSLPMPTPLSTSPLACLSLPESQEQLKKVSDRLIALNKHVNRELEEMHVDLLCCLDRELRHAPLRKLYSKFVFTALRAAVAEIPCSMVLERGNPALFLLAISAPEAVRG